MARDIQLPKAYVTALQTMRAVNTRGTSPYVEEGLRLVADIWDAGAQQVLVEFTVDLSVANNSVVVLATVAPNTRLKIQIFNKTTGSVGSTSIGFRKSDGNVMELSARGTSGAILGFLGVFLEPGDALIAVAGGNVADTAIRHGVAYQLLAF